MTLRDLAWRAAGLALMLGGCLGAALDRDGSPVTVLCFVIALTGLPLMLHGKRVAVMLQVERRGHGETAAAIHAERLRSHRPCDGD